MFVDTFKPLIMVGALLSTLFNASAQLAPPECTSLWFNQVIREGECDSREASDNDEEQKSELKRALNESETVHKQAEIINCVDLSVLEVLNYWERSSLDAVLDYSQKYAKNIDEKRTYVCALSKLRSLKKLERPGIKTPRFYDYRDYTGLHE